MFQLFSQENKVLVVGTISVHSLLSAFESTGYNRV